MGSEARAQVPDAFVAQDPRIANPPTFLLPIHKLAKRLINLDVSIVEVDGDSPTMDSTQTVIGSFLVESLPRLHQWIQYIMKTQASSLPNSYHWYGRNDKHCLASGFDDFPRHSILSDTEGHVDLVSWLVYSLKTLAELQALVDPKAENVQQLYSEAEELQNHLLNEYWDESVGFFGDLGMIRNGDDYIIGFETHVGYTGLLPFALQLLDSSDPRIEKILDAIEDPEQVGNERRI